MLSAVEKHRFYQMNQSINKAVNALETPVKEKHVRSTIIGTFHEKGAGTFWVVALRLPLQENRIVAWKFCNVLHKVLREGHFNCLQQSQRHKEMIVNLGKLWVYLKESYGKLIHLYSNLLVTKINFHERNPQFPGNLQLTGEELDAIGENDINIYFQLSVEIFDYMDDVLALQCAILDLFDNSRSSSMTSSGQCRLSPLIPCIQDSNQLYDFSVKLLFKLHSMLPADTLSGHRQRFLKQFSLLKKVYDVTHSMQFFQNLITIPSLPDNSPNFLIQSELTSYRPPVVILPPEEQYDINQEMIANLIDTSDSSSQIMSPDTPSDSLDSGQVSELIIQRDNLIDNLQSEITRLRNENESIASEHRATIASMNDQFKLLGQELASTKRNLECEKEQFDLLKRQLPEPSAPDLEQKLAEAAEKEKQIDEKYQKIKSAYMKMREEHIQLLRQNGETEKQLKKLTTEYEMNSKDMEQKIHRMNDELSKINETHVNSGVVAKTEADLAKMEIENQAQKHRIEVSELNEKLNESTARLETLEQEMSSQTDKYIRERDELTEQIEKLESDYALSKQQNSSASQMLEQNCEELNSTLAKLSDDLEEAKNNSMILSQKYTVEQRELNESMNTINDENDRLKREIDSLSKKYENEINELKNNYDQLIQQHNDVNKENEQLNNKIAELIGKHKDETEEFNNTLQNSYTELDNVKQELHILAERHRDEKLELEERINRHDDENRSMQLTNSNLIQNFDSERNELQNLIDDVKKELDDIKLEKNNITIEKANTENKFERCIKEKLTLESDLQDLLQNKETIEESLSSLTSKYSEKEEELLKEQKNVSSVLWSLMRCGIQSASEIIKGTIDEFDNPAISSLHCGPDYFRSFLPITNDTLSSLENSLKAFEQNKRPTEDIALQIVKAIHLLNTVIIQGVATSNTSKDIVFGENMAQECKKLANSVLACVRYVQLFDSNAENGQNGVSAKAEEHISTIKKLIESVSEFAGSVSGQDDVSKGDSIEGEISNMEKAIEEAATKIEEMLKASRAADSGLKLEVNEKILDACTSLMAAVRELVKKSRLLQAEIVSLGKGTNTDKEFYKRNHQWTEGLISAAKAVAFGANLLLISADKVVTSGGKLEQVMVASQEIAASTAQLVVASRVRAARGSARLEALSVASRAVSSATGAVIATAKSCAQLVEETEELDMSGMSLQMGRRKEMDSQIRVLELEQALANERLKLAALRRTNYRLADTETT